MKKEEMDFEAQYGLNNADGSIMVTTTMMATRTMVQETTMALMILICSRSIICRTPIW
jgi:hypothetical protein